VADDQQVVVDRTQAAVELLTLPPLADPQVQEIFQTHRGNALVTADYQVRPIDPRLGLDGCEFAGCLPAEARWILVRGALVESFVLNLLRSGPVSELTLVVEHVANVFLSAHSAQWYRDRGILIEPVRAVPLHAIVVNPTAPGSHELDSAELRRSLAQVIATVPIIDIRDPAYAGAGGLRTNDSRERRPRLRHPALRGSI
jgi:hypothetical protein